VDISKQIGYWINGANSDIETAALLINGRKFTEGLFFCHLTIEKALKALVVNNTSQLAPKSHNLGYLAELGSVQITDEQMIFMSILMKYQLEGRYPEYFPSLETVNDYFLKTKNLLECLKAML